MESLVTFLFYAYFLLWKFPINCYIHRVNSEPKYNSQIILTQHHQILTDGAVGITY